MKPLCYRNQLTKIMVIIYSDIKKSLINTYCIKEIKDKAIIDSSKIRLSQDSTNILMNINPRIQKNCISY